MTARLDLLRAAMDERSLAAMIVTSPAGVRWLSRFRTPEDARVLVTKHDAWLLTDGRYAVQAAEESVVEPVIERDWMGEVYARVRSGPVGVEAEHMTLQTAARFTGRMGEEPVRTEGVLAALRRRKDDEEAATLRRAAELTDRAFAHALTVVRPGVREDFVALEIERFVRLEGGDGMAFPIIVASGTRSSMPHGLASSKEIEAGELVTIDMGARVDGYCADMTRTFGVGDVSDAHRYLFDAVLAAQQATVDRIAPGVSGSDLDAVARDVLVGHGLGEAFVHSTGHGVGLEIHEAPRLASQSEDVLEPGMVLTVEPGAYHPGDAGVRIEDLVLVTASGAEVLSKSPRTWRSLPTADPAD